MLTHLLPREEIPERVVILGAGGFIGRAIAGLLQRQGIPWLGVTRQQADLLAPEGVQRLAALLRDGDSVVAAAAIAPCKNSAHLRDNMVMTTALITALQTIAPAHLLSIGSDAVFVDQDHPLRENSPKAPDSLHGVMHLAREIAFRAEVAAPLAILRPTLVYGAQDPHGGYGPNQFRRKANQDEEITLFGAGEERRDHVYIDDVADLAMRMLMRRSTGTLNAATGQVTSFRAVAEQVLKLAGRSRSIVCLPRRGPMPHDGYRAFDVSATRQAFPDFIYRTLASGLALAQSEEFPHG
jgi:UDP-glucose 4-epimerase